MGLLSLENARLRFGGIVALDDVSLDVAEGTIAGLIGPNGAGKTTAFNAITRLYRLDAGDVLFDGRSLRHTPPSRVIRLGIARTFQNVELFPTMTRARERPGRRAHRSRASSGSGRGGSGRSRRSSTSGSPTSPPGPPPACRSGR